MKVNSNGFYKNKKHIYNPNTYGYLDVGISFIIFVLAFIIGGRLFSRGIKFTGPIYRYCLKDVYFLNVLSVMFSQGIVMLVAFVYSRIRKVGLFNGGGYAFKWNLLDITMACILAFGIFFVFETVHQAVSENFNQIFGTTTSGNEEGSFVWLCLYVFILVPLLPAFCEEALMRGVFARSTEKFGIIFNIIVSGFAFGIFHGNPHQLFLQSISGMAMVLVFMSTKNFVIPMAMHAFHNLFSSLYEVMLNLLKEQSAYAVYWAKNMLIFVGVIACIIGLIYFIKKLLKKKDTNHNISLKKKVYLLNTQTNTITEEYACNTKVIQEKLDNGELFLNGKNFISKNKNGNKIVGFILVCVALVIGILDVFGCLTPLVDLIF